MKTGSEGIIRKEGLTTSIMKESQPLLSTSLGLEASGEVLARPNSVLMTLEGILAKVRLPGVICIRNKGHNSVRSYYSGICSPTTFQNIYVDGVVAVRLCGGFISRGRKSHAFN